jgi:hypothetical protein
MGNKQGLGSWYLLLAVASTTAAVTEFVAVSL